MVLINLCGKCGEVVEYDDRVDITVNQHEQGYLFHQPKSYQMCKNCWDKGSFMMVGEQRC